MSDNTHFIHLEMYNPPKAIEKSNREWVAYGEKNDYFDFLIDRLNGSTTNYAIVNTICKLVYGSGLNAADSNRNPSGYAQMKMLFNSDFLKKIVYDYYALGQCAIEVIYNVKKDKILSVNHLPMNLMRSGKCDEEGNVNDWFFAQSWEYSKLRRNPATPIPVFSNGENKNEKEVLIIGNYSIGKKYYCNVSYIGCLPYCKHEEEIANYLINEVTNSFTPTSIINFNNGVPETKELQNVITQSVEEKLTGSKGKKVIVAFNSDETKKTTIDSVPLNDAPAHYQYLSLEAQSKIMIGHGVTSTLLFGINTSNGFSSNADELKNAFVLFENMKIKPIQQDIIDGLNKILYFNGITLDLYFTTLKPFEFNDKSIPLNTDANEKNTGVKMASVEVESDLDLNEWELIDSRKVDYETENELDEQLKRLNKKPFLERLAKIVSSGTARPNASSSIDGEKFKSRYRYTGEVKDNTRPFCKEMLSKDKLYRKEDIDMMSQMPVNKGWGAEGADTYDIFLYKGGGDCHHYWTRETYRLKSDVNNPLAEQIGAAQARKEGEILPTADPRAYTAPKDMPFNGFLPTNKRFN